MLSIATIASTTSTAKTHPLEEHLHQQLVEHGYTIVEPEQAKILICMGEALQGFTAASIAQIEAQFTERFLGAELFLLARAFPFARIRVGINASEQLIIATPLDESTLFRLIRLLDQFKRLKPTDYESSMGGFTDLPSTNEGLQTYTTPQTTGAKLEDHAESVKESPSSSSTPLSIQQPNVVSTPMSWQEKLTHWQLRKSKQTFTMPPELAHAGIQQVLKSTTQFETRQDPMGQLYGLFGFPDLVRPNSRILLVTSDGGVIAMHRKQQTAILSPLVEDLLFSLKEPFPTWADEVLENRLNGADGFALEGTRVYGKSDTMILSATTVKSAKTEGKANPTIASLLLQWSTR